VLPARPTGDEELYVAVALERFAVGWIQWCQNTLPYEKDDRNVSHALFILSHMRTWYYLKVSLLCL
jgi:hypothetical protein